MLSPFYLMFGECFFHSWIHCLAFDFFRTAKMQLNKPNKMILWFFFSICLWKMRKTTYMHIWWSILVNWQLPYVRLSYKSNENLYLVEMYVCLAKQWNVFLTIQPAILGNRLMSINEIVSQKIFIQKKKKYFRCSVFICFFWISSNNLYVPDLKRCQHYCECGLTGRPN